VEAEDERRHAVGQPDGQDAERPTRLEGEPHERDVLERVAELAGRHGDVDAAEVPPPEKPEGAALGRDGVNARLLGGVGHRVGHRPLE
jgi:hypothetical protein